MQNLVNLYLHGWWEGKHILDEYDLHPMEWNGIYTRWNGLNTYLGNLACHSKKSSKSSQAGNCESECDTAFKIGLRFKKILIHVECF